MHLAPSGPPLCLPVTLVAASFSHTLSLKHYFSLWDHRPKKTKWAPWKRDTANHASVCLCVETTPLACLLLYQFVSFLVPCTKHSRPFLKTVFVHWSMEPESPFRLQCQPMSSRGWCCSSYAGVNACCVTHLWKTEVWRNVFGRGSGSPRASGFNNILNHCSLTPWFY